MCRGPLIKESLYAVQNINNHQLKQQTLTTDESSRVILKPRIIAIEKNPSAVLYIQSLCYKLQNDQEFDIFGYPNEYANNLIYIIESDMRNMIHQPIMQQLLSKQNNKQEGIADIIVSELLGSFGDNELSPECLDGISNDIMKKDCFSIPQELATLHHAVVLNYIMKLGCNHLHL